jgi:hypothetical protein
MYLAPIRRLSGRNGPRNWEQERATLIEFKNPAVPEQVGDNLVVGDGPWVVSVNENWMETELRFDGTATYVIVEQDGTMKIASHYWTGTASQPET